MSGILGSIASVAEALGGSAVVTLGSFSFTDTEVPQSLPYGGDQRLAVLKMIGGARQVNAIGGDPQPIRWSGLMRSADRSARASTLQQMTAAGKPLPLTWANEYVTVVIQSFVPVAMPFWIAYTISCVVVADATNGQIATHPNLLTSITNDALSAVGLTPSDLAGASSAVGELSNAVSAVGALVPGSSAFASILSATGVAQSALGAAQQAADGNLSGIIADASVGVGVLGTSNLSTALSRVSVATTAIHDVAGATQALGFVNRIGANLAAQL